MTVNCSEAAARASTTSLNPCRWKLAGTINGPAIAFFVSLEFLISLSTCSFIVIHSIWKAKEVLQNSSGVFLFSFILSNFLIVLLYMPLVVVTASAEEWIFGSTDEMRTISCHIQGFIYLCATGLAFVSLAIISVDRFLSIVFIDFHKKFISWKFAHTVMVITWVLILGVPALLIYSVPRSPLLPVWVPLIGVCHFNIQQSRWATYLPMCLLIPFFIIVFSTLATFIYTHFILRKNLRRQRLHLNHENFDIQRSIYSVRIKTLVGLFTLLILSHVILVLPFVVGAMIAGSVKVGEFPSSLGLVLLHMYLFSNVLNPFINALFIQDFVSALKAATAKSKEILCKKKRSQ